MRAKFTTLLAALAVAMISLPALADGVEVTDKLVNPDFTNGLEGWTSEFTTPDMSNGNLFYWTDTDNENEAGKEGYWFFDGASMLFHATDASYAGLPGRFYQTLEGMPNGAYVFSGVSGFVRFGADYTDPDDKYNCQGGYFFANEDKTQIQGFTATRFSPEFPWCHTVRFNVATIVTDGTLTVGQKFEEGNNANYCSFEQARLYYFGDVDTETAMLQMRHINVDFDSHVCDTMKVKPMSTERYEHLCAMQQIAKDAETYDELTASLDSMRISLGYARKSFHQFEPLVKLIDTAKGVMEQEWSENVAEQVRQLGIAIEQAEQDLADHTIGEADFAAYKTDFENKINMVRIDQLWDKLDELNVFLNDPYSVSEDSPCFGLTEHPGFGSDEGQFPEGQYDELSQLYDEVNNLLYDIETGVASATAGFAYVATIEAAVKNCISMAIGAAITLPYDYILDPDPSNPSQAYACAKAGTLNQPAIQARKYSQTLGGVNATCYRVETPVLKTNRAYASLKITVLHTHQNKTFTSGGPAFSINEFYLIDENGNRVALTGDDFSSNAKEANEGSYAGLCDNNVSWTAGTYFHSSWSGTTYVGNHNLIVMLPEPMSTFKLVFESVWDEGRVSNTPTEILISGQTAIETVLQNALNNVENINYTWGQDPFFYSTDFTPFQNAKDKVGSYLAGAEGTEEQMIAAADALLAEADKLKDIQANLINEGEEYFITSRQLFVDNQGIQKNMSVYQDSILIWETADVNNANQKFVFEKVAGESEDGLPYYNIKNVGTGKYIGPVIPAGEAWEPTGEEITWGNPTYVKMTEEPCAYGFNNLGKGQVAITYYSYNIANYCVLACNNSNSGKYSETRGSSGASALTPAWNFTGQNGPIVHYNAGGANTTSAFSLVPAMKELPATIPAAQATDKNLWHFSTGGKLFVFAADKPCAFTNFKVLDKEHNEITISTKTQGNQLVVTFPKNYADFYFTFDNDEGVQNITVDIVEGGKTKLDYLQEAYNKVYCQYSEGTEVGSIVDLKDYNAAIAKAEELLENGGEDEEVAAATEALYAATEALVTVQPEAGKRYCMIAATRRSIVFNHREVAIYVNPDNGILGWHFLDATNENFLWEFEKGETEGTWYIRNVATGTYINYADATGINFSVYDMPTPYEIIAKDTTSVTIHCAEEEAGKYNWCLHLSGIGSIDDGRGGRTYGPICFYGDNFGARFFIREAKDPADNIDVIEAEEQRPAVMGIYDLTGRRVANPATGIYIVNGKKMLIQ